MRDFGTVLAFHQTSDRFYPGINNVKPKHFISLIKLIEKWGFSFWCGEDSTTENESANRVVVTFDDGYRDQYEILKWLCDQGIKPIVFIPTAYIGKQNRWEYSSRLFPSRHLDQQQIADLATRGVLFGTHGDSHRALTNMTDNWLRQELSGSRQTIEGIVNHPVDLLSFPFGRTAPRINDIARECGFKKGFILDRNDNDMSESEDFVVPRVPIYGIDDYYTLKVKLLGQSRFENVKNRIINNLSGGTIIASQKLK
jgi:peptidoglycan/xylan/chitin deacetylase (PgdA/CDA1 family)